MSLFIVDVEADGPVPGMYSMVSFGAVKFDEELETTFYGTTAPVTDNYIDRALSVSNTTREQHLIYDDPLSTMQSFERWIQENNEKGRPIFVSDNPAFDWQWINYYFHVYLGDNPFGWTARRIGDLYCGMEKDFTVGAKWKKFRKTKHDHHPVNDAKSNAEVLHALKERGLNFKRKNKRG